MRAILTYHSIDDTGSAISVRPRVFREQVKWMRSGAVRVLPLSEIHSADDTADAVSLTFDDGIATIKGSVADELLDSGLSATLYVVSGSAGRFNDWSASGMPGVPRLPILTWDDVGHLAARGFSIGSHTHTHANLATCTPVQLSDELDRSIAEILRHTGTTPRTFAYPYGALNEEVVAQVRARFATACTTRLATLGTNEDPVRLPRIDMYYFRRSGMLEAWGSGSFRAYVNARRFLRDLRLSAT